MAILSWRCLSFPSSFLISFSHCAAQLCPFPTLQRSPQDLLLSSAFGISLGFTPSPLNSAYIFWSRSKIVFCLNCLILWWYLLTLALFASILCFRSTVFNPFLFTIYLSFISFNFRFFLNCSSLLTSFSRSQSLHILLNRTFPPWFIFFRWFAFFNPIRSTTQAFAALIKLFVSVMLLLCKYLIISLTLSVWTFKTFLSTFLNIMSSPVLPPLFS